MSDDTDRLTPKRGFAAISIERQREIASMGGKAVADDKRTFSKDPTFAAEAGKMGGKAVPNEKRSFVRNPELAREAGRKGGLARGLKVFQPE